MSDIDIELEGHRVYMFADAFNRMISVIQKRFGSAGESMLYSMSREFGEYNSRMLLEALDEADRSRTEEDLLRWILDSVEIGGWGKAAIDRFDLVKGEIDLSLTEQGLCIEESSPDSGQCFFTRGFLAGVIKAVTDQDFSPTATECKSTPEGTCHHRFKRELA